MMVLLAEKGTHMLTRRLCSLCLFCLTLLAACGGSTPQGTTSTRTPGPSATASVSPSPTPIPTPIQYTSRVILRGSGHPDDLAFDPQGRLLFSDEKSGTISRLNADGTVTVLMSGLPGPEGLVSLSDGTLIISEQPLNQIASFAPGATTPTVLRKLPGTPSGARCKDGVDNIGLDPTNNTLIVPDSPTGDVYRMSLDGKSFTLLTSGIVRPVGAFVDTRGTIYISDECGAAVWRVTPAGEKTKIGGVSMPDDALLDPEGNLLVIDLDPAVHALVRLDLTTGQKETLESKDFAEPQGLVMDAQGHVFVSDDIADVIVEFTPM
jgi:sugar lactone lactonase YvrE